MFPPNWNIFLDAMVSLSEVSLGFKLDIEYIALSFCMVLGWSFATEDMMWRAKAGDPLPFFGGVTIDSLSFSFFLCFEFFLPPSELVMSALPLWINKAGVASGGGGGGSSFTKSLKQGNSGATFPTQKFWAPKC